MYLKNQKQVIENFVFFIHVWKSYNGSLGQQGSIIRIGVTCKKMPCYMGDSACRWRVV